MQIKSVKVYGELETAMLKAYAGLRANYPYSDDYLLATINYKEDVFAHHLEYSGDVPGRWIIAMVAMEKFYGLNPRLHKLIKNLLPHQRSSGMFGRKEQSLETTNRAQIYGNGWLLQGLVAYYEHTGDKAVLESALRLGKYYEYTVQYWLAPEERSLIVTYGHAYGCFTHGLDGIVSLYRITGEKRWLKLAKTIADVADPYEKSVHSHMHLSTLRGMLALYKECSEEKYLDTVIDEVKKVAKNDMLPTGGIFECYGTPYLDEACSTCDFLYINYHLWELTDDLFFLHEVEKIFWNHMLYSQLDNGLFGSLPVHFEYLDKSGNPAYWCCAMFGTTVLADYPKLAYNQKDNIFTLQLLVDGVFTFDRHGKEVEIQTKTDYPRGNIVDLTISNSSDEELLIRLIKPFNATTVEIYSGNESSELISSSQEDFIELPVCGKGTVAFQLKLDLPIIVRAQNIIASPDNKFKMYQDANIYVGPLMLSVSKLLKRRGHFIVLVETSKGQFEFYDAEKSRGKKLDFAKYPVAEQVSFIRLTNDIIDNITNGYDLYTTTVEPVYLEEATKCKVTFDVIVLTRETLKKIREKYS